MSEEQEATVADDEQTTETETLDGQQNNDAEGQPEDKAAAPEVETVEEEQTSDLVAEALAEKERLQAELEALKTDDTNVFEQNAKLKADLEEAKKLQEVASENAKLKAQLEDAKRQTMIDSMIKTGQLTNNLKEWADGLSFDQLQQFKESAPRRKNILEEKNPTGIKDDTMLEFVTKQKQSRILQMAAKKAIKKTTLEQDRAVLNEIMTRTDKQEDLRGLRKTLIMAVRQIDDAISYRKR